MKCIGFFFCFVASLAIWGSAVGVVAEELAASPSPPPGDVETIISKEETIEMKVGDKRRIPIASKVLDAEVTRPEVADAFVSGSREMVLTANSPGVGRVVLQLDKGEKIAFTIRVYVADPESFVNQLKKELEHIRNINIEVVKGRILVEGRVLYLTDMDAIERAIGDNPSIINLTSLSSRNTRILAREIERELRESGIYGVRVEVRNNRVTLVGSLSSEALVRRAEHIASTYTHTFESLLKAAQRSDETSPLPPLPD